jgi:hypothetical protein
MRLLVVSFVESSAADVTYRRGNETRPTDLELSLVAPDAEGIESSRERQLRRP